MTHFLQVVDLLFDLFDALQTQLGLPFHEVYGGLQFVFVFLQVELRTQMRVVLEQFFGGYFILLVVVVVVVAVDLFHVRLHLVAEMVLANHR